MGVLKKLFGKYLLLTNTVTCGIMMGFGDLMQQRNEHWKRQNSKKSFCELESKVDIEKSMTPTDIEDCDKEYEHDYIRTKNMLIVGVVQGPFHHYFYAILDRTLPGKDAVSIFKKTLLDQFIASPTCLAIFFFGLGALEHQTMEEIQNEVKLKFMDTWKVDWCFWPPIQFINFLFVPIRYRVLYINLMTMIYDMFLSYIKHVSNYIIQHQEEKEIAYHISTIYRKATVLMLGNPNVKTVSVVLRCSIRLRRREEGAADVVHNVN